MWASCCADLLLMLTLIIQWGIHASIRRWCYVGIDPVYRLERSRDGVHVAPTRGNTESIQRLEDRGSTLYISLFVKQVSEL